MSLKNASENKDYVMATHKRNNEPTKEKKDESITEKNDNPWYVVVCIHDRVRTVVELVREKRVQECTEQAGAAGQAAASTAVLRSYVPTSCFAIKAVQGRWQ